MQKAREALENLQKVGLSDEEHLLRVLIDNMPDYIYVKDTRSKFIVANRKLAQVHHLDSPVDMIGKSDHDFYPRELAEKYYRDEQEIMTSGRPMINLEEAGLDEYGNEIFLSTTKIPLKDKSGNVIGLVGIDRDITDHKMAERTLIGHTRKMEQVNKLLEEKQEEIRQQAEELLAQTENLTYANHELEKLSIAVSETDNVVIILDAEGNFEWVNKSFTRVYGRTLEQWISKKGKSILSGSHNPNIRDILHQCRKSGKTVHYESEAHNKEGQTIWTQSTLTPVLDPDGNIVRFVAIDSDITALKRAQELIDEQRKELESQRNQLEKANITKDKFFSIIAHDLRNPFHSILGFSDLLIKNFSEIEDDKKREYLGLISDSSHYANNLLENLLNWSRTQSDTIKYSPGSFDLYPLVKEIELILNGALAKKKLIFENRIPEGSRVYADKNMVQTVLRNLISNAIKFTPEGGTVTVYATPLNGKLSISVRDTGTGIPISRQKALFNFDEFHSTAGTAGESGTGLGLIICNDFIKKHGGELTFHSKEGEGTTFTFSLQLDKNPD